MTAVVLRDRRTIETFLRRDPFLHLYEIGDLDAPYWDHTTWYALEEEGEIASLALLYTGTSIPVLLGLGREPLDPLRELLRQIGSRLPSRFYAHLSGDLVELFAGSHRVEAHGAHWRMALAHPERLDAVDTSPTTPLTLSDYDEMKRLYDASYPGHWFERSMLAAGRYYGIRRDGKLICVAGVHVFSARYRVAALGNITTHPRFRGQGLATSATARLCRELRGGADHIGLNVHEGNINAITCYEKLGFERHATYGEFLIEAR